MPKRSRISSTDESAEVSAAVHGPAMAWVSVRPMGAPGPGDSSTASYRRPFACNSAPQGGRIQGAVRVTVHSGKVNALPERRGKGHRFLAAESRLVNPPPHALGFDWAQRRGVRPMVFKKRGQSSLPDRPLTIEARALVAQYASDKFAALSYQTRDSCLRVWRRRLAFWCQEPIGPVLVRSATWQRSRPSEFQDYRRSAQYVSRLNHLQVRYGYD